LCYIPRQIYEKLGIHCRIKNRGINYNPELNAANTAQLYIAKHKIQAPTLREKAGWDKWGVVEADLDNNTDTRDNVIVYDDFAAGKIRTIDGYGITSGQRK
jgi:hypothetical protein